MSVVEFLLWATLAFIFWKKSLSRRFPAMATYLGLHLVSTPILLLLLYEETKHASSSFLFSSYFYGYFGVYIASAILLLFVSLEIFRTALVAFPGLLRIGLVIFRWAILVSLIVTLSSVSFVHRGMMLIPEIAIALMRSVSVLELCLLAFLCLSMNALRLSVRDLPFGIAFGFGLMAADEFILASLKSATSSSMTTPLQFAYEALILLVLSIWIAYAALPQPSLMPVVMPASSAIQRWNEIASALGHPGTQVAVQQPANGFFLTDVEKVVEKVLKRNLKGRESEL